MADVLVISGLSGAGRTEAAGVLEDLGWYVVDNLPTSLVEKIVELASVPGSTASCHGTTPMNARFMAM